MRLKLFAAILSVIALVGCTSFNQRYYASSEDDTNVNYYRISLTGWTFFTSSEFRADPVPAVAVEALLGDQNSGNGNNGDNEGSGSFCGYTSSQLPSDKQDTAPSQPKVKPRQISSIINPATGRAMKDQKIVYTLSSNPNQIFEQMQTFAAAVEQDKALMGILTATERKELIKEKRRFTRVKWDNYAVIDKAKDVETRLTEVFSNNSTTVDQKRNAMADQLKSFKSFIELAN